MEGHYFGLLWHTLSIRIMKDTELPRRQQHQYLKPQLYHYTDKCACGQPLTNEGRDYLPPSLWWNEPSQF